MDRRITIGVVAVLALLGAYIWYTFLRADAPPLTPTTPQPTAIAFMNVDPDTVQSVQVRDLQGNKTTLVKRNGETWTMEQPAQGEANAARLDELLFAVAQVNADRQLALPSDLTPFGLNPAKYEAVLGFDNGASITILIGNKNPEGTSYYALRQGDPNLYLIHDTTGETVEQFVTTPPYTPTPTPTELPSATPEATATP